LPNHPVKTAAFFLFTLFILILTSQIPPPAGAQSPQRASYAGELAGYMQTQMEDYRIPGAALAIVRNGEVEYQNGFGIANRQGRAVTPDTPFLLASVSKSMTALGVMQLVEAGKVRLDDPVSQYIPWFKVSGGGGEQITVADLLYHTSGLSELGGVQLNLFPDSVDALEAGVRSLAGQELAFLPGEGWEYSNLNYNMLGLIIQQVSGQTYEAYMEAQLFGPLEMDNSFTSMSAARAAGAASGYYPFFGLPVPYESFMPYSRASLPSAGLWSSAADMSRYLLAHLDGGRTGDRSLVSEAGFAALHQPGYMFHEEQGYAMGWTANRRFMPAEHLEPLDTELKNFDSPAVLFHEGDWAGYKSMAFLIPEAEYGMILLLNTNDPTIPSAFRFFVWDIALIATGGEAQYFPPAESFFDRNTREIFTLISLLLAGGLIYSLRVWKRSHQPGAAAALNPGRILAGSMAVLLATSALLGTIYGVLLPDNKADLASLLRFAPDLGLLAVLVTLLSIAWGAVCIGLIASSRIRRARRMSTTPGETVSAP
jgi:CubicO group peptidase (beta-lactamase class C family)